MTDGYVDAESLGQGYDFDIGSVLISTWHPSSIDQSQ